jgi:hypothetical protein
MPLAASVISAYCLFDLGKALTGSEVSCYWNTLKACISSGGRRPFLWPESFLVTLNSGATIIAESLMWVQKKLQRPTKHLTILILVAGWASRIACSFFHFGLMLSGVNMNPRYDTSRLPKTHFSRFTLWGF